MVFFFSHLARLVLQVGEIGELLQGGVHVLLLQPVLIADILDPYRRLDILFQLGLPS